jgi:hypothetical protein
MDNFHISKHLEYGSRNDRAFRVNNWLKQNKNFVVHEVPEFSTIESFDSKPEDLFADILRNDNIRTWDQMRPVIAERVKKFASDKIISRKVNYSSTSAYLDYYNSFRRIIPELPPASAFVEETETTTFNGLVDQIPQARESMTVQSDLYGDDE